MTYNHRIQYYETDKMAVVHHSNYIRWFEEARIAFLESIGINFSEWEKQGFSSPVVSLGCRYLRPMLFGETASIQILVRSLTAAKLEFEYQVTNPDGVLCCTGTSTHCFCGSSGQPVLLKRENPSDWNLLKAAEEPLPV